MKFEFENTPKKTVVDYFDVFLNFSEDSDGNLERLIRISGLLLPILKWHSLIQSVRTFWGVYPAACLVGTGCLFLGVERPEHEANNSILNVNKNPTTCNSKQIFIYCKVTLHVSGIA